jgi:phosphoserine/homoserine phosphotransferase
MFIICLDLEGILTPEVWINVSKKTGIEKLKLTTRDIPDYNVLMDRRLAILREHNITLKDIQRVISEMGLLPGAFDFLNWLRKNLQVIILSDTFIEFAMPFMKKLGYPTLLCHELKTDKKGMIADYKLRLEDQKTETVKAFRKLNYDVIAVGDSYNDTSMLLEATYGILFRPPPNVIEEFPQFPVITEYTELKKIIKKYIE